MFDFQGNISGTNSLVFRLAKGNIIIIDMEANTKVIGPSENEATQDRSYDGNEPVGGVWMGENVRAIDEEGKKSRSKVAGRVNWISKFFDKKDQHFYPCITLG